MLSRFFIFILCCTAAVGFCSDTDNSGIGVINFSTCLSESKFGKQEQEKMENLRNQWMSLIQQTKKEADSVAAKFEDKEFLEGLSPQAEEDLKLKYKTLNEDLSKYQNQLTQEIYQANYLIYQKLYEQITKIAEKLAVKNKKFLMLNKEAAFYSTPAMDMTKQVVAEMDAEFDKAPKTPTLPKENDLKKLEEKKAPADAKEKKGAKK